jgi:hypothetical protein
MQAPVRPHPFHYFLRKDGAFESTIWIVLAPYAARPSYFAAANAPALQVAVVGVKMGFALSSIAVISLPFTVTA